jgi:hypothetical protein
MNGLVRIVLPSGNEAVYSDARATVEETRRYGCHVATKFREGWRERGSDWRLAHESDARRYELAPLLGKEQPS